MLELNVNVGVPCTVFKSSELITSVDLSLDTHVVTLVEHWVLEQVFEVLSVAQSIACAVVIHRSVPLFTINDIRIQSLFEFRAELLSVSCDSFFVTINVFSSTFHGAICKCCWVSKHSFHVSSFYSCTDVVSSFL